MNTITHQKQQIRLKMRQQLSALSADQLKQNATFLSAKLQNHPLFLNSNNILIYYPINYEPNLLDFFLNSSKNLFLPYIKTINPPELGISPFTSTTHLHPHPKLQIPEPPTPSTELSPTMLDLIIVPGLAFDSHHNRLGQGLGFYDRLLSTHPQIPTLALAHSLQILPSLPTALHDQKITAIISS